MDSRPHAAEVVHQILGTTTSFSSKPDDLDAKVVEKLMEIRQNGSIDGFRELGDAFAVHPEHLPKGFFFSSTTSYWEQALRSNRANGAWRPHRSLFGYGIRRHASGYSCFKRTLVYHKDNHKTNLILVAYNLIEDGNIKADAPLLCHVFQSDSYDPRPDPPPILFCARELDFIGFDETELHSRVLRLEDLMEKPESFKDFYELDEMYSKCQTNGLKGKRAGVWKHFTPINVLGPDGEVMLTLAICNRCGVAYKTGKWDHEKEDLSNNGTKTLTTHNLKCSGQHHVAGNP